MVASARTGVPEIAPVTVLNTRPLLKRGDMENEVGAGEQDWGVSVVIATFLPRLSVPTVL